MQDESVYLGLGSNVGDRTAHLRAGLAGLRERGLQIRSVSSFYLTEPDLRAADEDDATGCDHPWYVNCVAAVAGAPAAEELMELCLAVEVEHGRARGSVSNSGPEPRTLDIDILMIGNSVIDGSTVRVPHPRMRERRFVLAPLAEIAPDARHPASGATIDALLAELPARERVWLLAPPPEGAS